MRLLKIAIRNTRRNARRTAITVITVVIGVFVIVLARGLVKGFQNETIVRMIETRTGDIQIHKIGYRETLDVLPLDLTIEFDDILEELEGAEGIKEISGRILFSGQLTTEEESALLSGQAVDVDKELIVCPRLKDNMILGEFLTPSDRNKIVITRDLYKTLDAKLGDTFTLFATSKEGAINATELILKGVIHFDLPDSKRKAGYIPLRTVQDLLLMDGIVTEVVLKREENSDITGIIEEIRSKFAGYEFEINTWKEIEQNIVRMEANHGFLSMVVSLILFIIVVSTVMNTMLMVVLERINEIGTLMAVGFKRKQILSLFLLEGCVKGLIGGIIGAFLGSVAVLILNTKGIPFSMPGSDEAAYIIRPEIDHRTIVMALLFSLGAAVLASLYPADRASRMHPVEALRNV